MDSNQDFGSILNNFSGSTNDTGLGALLNSYQQPSPRHTTRKGTSAPIDSTLIQGVADREGLSPTQRRVMAVLLDQESSGGRNTATSTDGAMGAGQIMPGTFKMYAKPGEDINNTEHNLAVMSRIVKDLGTKFGDDPARMATGYFSGEGNVSRSGSSAWKADHADGNGKRVSNYVSDVVGKLGNVVDPTDKQAKPQNQLPDLADTPKWSQIAAGKKYNALPAAEQKALKAKYFDEVIAPHVQAEGADVGAERTKFLAEKQGMLSQAWDATKGMFDGKESVLEGAPPAPELATASRVPVRKEVRAAFNAAWDAATPEKRELMQAQEGWTGMLARERAGVFERQDTVATPTTQKLDPRIEARRNRLVGAGEDPAFAERAALEGANRGVVPGRELEALGGMVQKSEFDFDTNAMFDTQGDRNGLNNPLGRGVTKAVLGTGKAAAGYMEFLGDVTGMKDGADGMRKWGKSIRGQEEAMGESGAMLERNLEGAISSIGQQLPLMIAGVTMGSQAIPLAGMALQSFGQEYSDGKAAGQSAGQAATRAGLFAAFEVIGEKFGLGAQMAALKGAAKGMPSDEIIGLLWSALKKEVPGEVLTTTGQFSVDKFAPGGVGLNPNATFADYVTQVGDTITQTIMQAGLMGAGTTGVSATVRYMKDRGPLEGVANADAELARQQALNKWDSLRVEPTMDGQLTVTPDGRIEPTGTPEAQSADSIVRELAEQAGIPAETVLPTPKPVEAPVIEAPVNETPLIDPEAEAQAAQQWMESSEVDATAQPMGAMGEGPGVAQPTQEQATLPPPPARPRTEKEARALRAQQQEPTNGLEADQTQQAEAQREEAPATATAVAPSQPVLQNRDRSNPASITQMQSIASNPDYGRLGFSRDFANGAPVVTGAEQGIPEQQRGKQDTAVAVDGTRIPVQYAVVDAGEVLTSNNVDGTSNTAYGDANTQAIRAIAGNGRVAGLTAAYRQGTAEQYKQELMADAALHGVPAEVIQGMQNPVLVRVMPQEAVTANIGDLSNTQGNLSLSAVEQAKNDMARVDLAALEFDESGGLTQKAVRQFVQAMPKAEQGGLIDTNGQPSKQAVDRLQAAVFAKAYGNDQLIRLFAQAQDPEARLILSALSQLAPKVARLEGAGALDIRPIIAQAAEIAVNARRDGKPIGAAAKQMDMAADPAVGVVLDLFASSPRSNKPIIEAIANAVDFAYAEANKSDMDMFGEVQRASRDDVINQLRPQNERASQQNLEQPAGRVAAEDDADGQQANAGPAADAGATEAGRATEATSQVTEPSAEYSVRQQFSLFGSTQSDQLQLFLDSGPVPVQAGPGAVAAQRESVAAVADLHATETILATALTRDYAARQRISLVGQTVKSAEDLAVLAQVYRDPRFETFRVVFVDAGGKSVSQLGLTSRLPASTVAIMGADAKAYLTDLMATAKSKGATGYYLLHNHPSGQASSSQADINVTREFAGGTPGMQMLGHVVIDTNEYSVIDEVGNTNLIKKDFGVFEPLSANMVEFNGPDDLVAYAKSVQAEAGAVTLIATDAQYKVKAITTMPAAAIRGDKGMLRLKVARALLRLQSSNVFAVGRESGALAKLSGIVVDAIHIEESGKATSLVSRGVMNSTNQGAFPSERRTRVTADSSPEFAYLRFDPSAMKSAGQRVAEGDLFSPSANAWQSDLFGTQPEAAPEPAKPKTEKEAKAQRAEQTPTLTSPTPADIEAQQDRAKRTERTVKAEKAAADEQAKRERERKEIAQASVGAADSFELGGDADGNLTGQGDLADTKPATVENFGEKLPPARRAMAAKLGEDLTDDKIASMPLSQIWPATENDAIEDTFVAAVAHVMREAIPAKPRTAYKVKSWVGKVRLLRGFAADIMSGKVTKEKFVAEMGKLHTLKDMLSKIKLLEQIDRADWARIGDVSEAPNAVRYEDNKQIPTPSVSVTVDGRNHWLRGSGDVAEHLDGIKAMLGTAAPENKMQFEIRQESRGDRKVFINKKGDKEYRRLMTFDTVAEARAAVQNQYTELVAAWEGVKSRDNITERDVRSDVNRDRTGKDHRKGKDVSAEDFESKFGFRGGEFGKWVKQGDGAKERQFLLNNAYEALMDLSDLLGIPPKAISLEGTLGIAFGSRGSGGAAAHFEPSNLVINLTKTRGAGSLAHEWFHALDNYFARKRGGEVPMDAGGQTGYRNNNYITHKTTPLMVRKDGRGSPLTKERLAQWRSQSPNSGYLAEDQWHEDPKHKAGVRVEVEQAFNDLVVALNASPMLKRARVLDGVKESGDGYWSRTLEMAARSFENFVQTRMMEQGYHNDFLANVKAAPEVGKNEGRYPYMMPNEIAPIASAFDGLFGTIQTKETADGKVAMFSRKGAQTIEAVNLKIEGWAGSKEQLRALAQGWYSDNLQGKAPVLNRDMGVSVVFTSEGKGTAFATSGNLRAGWKAEMVKALPELVARAVKVAESAPDARRTRDTRMFHTLVAPLSVNGTVYSAKITLREALEQKASPAHKFYDIAALEIGNGPEVYGLKDADVNQNPLPTPSEPLQITVRQLASAVNGLDIDASLSRGQGTPVTISEVQSVAQALLDGNAKAPKLVVVQKASDLPFDAPDDAKGVYMSGSLYLVADNLGPVVDGGNAVVGTGVVVGETVAHELIGHFGLRGFFGKELDQTLNQIHESNPKVQKLAYKWRQENTDLIAQWKQKFNKSDAWVKSRSIEEALASMAEKGEKLNGWRRLAAVVQSLLRKAGLTRLANMLEAKTDAEALLALKKAEMFVKKGLSVSDDVSDMEYPMFARAGSNPQLPLQGGANTPLWDVPPPSRMDDFIYNIQDRQINLKRVQQAIREVAAIPEHFDAYQKEELYHGRVAARTHKFLDREVKPLLMDMKLKGIDMDAMEAYLWARHAKERNAQIAKVNPGMPEGGSGLTDAQVDDYLAGADVVDAKGEVIIKGMKQADRNRLEALAARVDAINAGTKQVLLQYGLESPSTVAAWERTYKHYVPLHREDMDGVTPIGTGFSVKGDASKRALGSQRKVVDVLAHLALQREAAITRGEKNRVGLALYGLALQNKNADFWEADKVPMKRTIDKETGLVVERPDPMYKNSTNVLVLRVGGQDRAIVFNERDERAVRAVEVLKNLDVQAFGEIMGTLASATRFLAAINTQYNPVFGLINGLRDVQSAALNLTSTPLADRKWQVMKAVPSALRAIWKIERGGQAGNRYDALYEDLKMTGGTTGYREIFRMGGERAKALQKEFDKPNADIGSKALDALLDWLDHFNTAIENATRLAAYDVGTQAAGLTKDAAASLAKNVTVNFNRKGKIGREAGVFYAFFNAAVQGTTRMVETLKGPAGKKIMAGGVMLGVIQALVASVGFDDDEWEDIPEFVKERNFIIPTGENTYVMFPMPLGFNVLPNIGRISTDLALSGGKNMGKRVGDLLSAIVNAANPLGSSTLAQMIAPTVVDPIVALAENKNFAGSPIYKENRNPLQPTPGFTRAKDSSSAVSRGIAEGVNAVTGGTRYTPGWASPTPDQIDYIFGTLTGGAGRELNKLYQSVELQVTGQNVPESKKPIIGRFFGTTDDAFSVSARYWTNVKELNTLESEIKGRRKDRVDATEFKRDHPEHRLIGMANQYERAVSELRTARSKVEFDEKLTEGQRTERLKELDARIQAKMTQFNTRVAEAKKKRVAAAE